MGELVPLRRRSRRRLPAAWRPFLRRRGVSVAQVRMTLWAGLLLGLLFWQAWRLWSPWPVEQGFPLFAARAAPPDPYAEAARSRAILEAQEGAPSSGLPGGSPLDGADAPLRVSAQVHVIDGDTFDHDGVRVRIADIDTPEVHGQCPFETALAARATQRLRALLAAGPFALHPPGNGRDEDMYGRKLRIVTRGGRSLGDVLVAEGLARTWSGRREPWCQAQR